MEVVSAKFQHWSFLLNAAFSGLIKIDMSRALWLIFSICCKLIKGPCPGFRLVCVVSLTKPQTSSSCLLIEWNHKKRPQIDFTNLNFLFKFVKSSRLLPFPLSYLHLSAFLFSPQADTSPLTDSLCALPEGELGRYDLHWCKWWPERYWRCIPNPSISHIHIAFDSTRAACDRMTWYVWVIPQTASPSISNAIKQSQTIKDNIPIISMEIRNGMP